MIRGLRRGRRPDRGRAAAHGVRSPIPRSTRPQPDDSPERLDAPCSEIEACHSVAGDESYILKVRVAEPVDLRGPAGAEIRAAANVVAPAPPSCSRRRTSARRPSHC